MGAVATQIKNYFIKDPLKAVIAFAIVLISLAAAYYFLIALPSVENQRLDLERQQQEARQQAELEAKEQAATQAQQKSLLLDACLSDARANYDANWASSCKLKAANITKGYQDCLGYGGDASVCRQSWGYPPNLTDCTLPQNTADSWNNQYKDERNECYKRYPQ